MAFLVKTNYPKEESESGNKLQSNKRTEILTGVSPDEVLRLYRNYLTSGYQTKVSFKVPLEDDNGSDIEQDPIKIADTLTEQGIDYKAKLNFNDKGSYSDLLPAIHLIESAGFDLNATVRMKINEETSLNLDDPSSWTDEDAVLVIVPKATTNDINEIKGLYQNLLDKGYDVTIDVTPKPNKDDDEVESFEKQLKSYPDGTEVNFSLKDSEN